MTTGRGIRIAAVVAGGVLAAIVAVRLVSPSEPRVTVVRAEFGALKSWVMTNGIVEPVISDVARAHVPTYVTQVLVTEGTVLGTVWLSPDASFKHTQAPRPVSSIARTLTTIRSGTSSNLWIAAAFAALWAALHQHSALQAAPARPRKTPSDRG
jgi:hypothetical protein